jgi:hypothetical protein
MKTTAQYPGIDYSNGLSNRDPETGIRYGVISQNSCMAEAIDDIMTYGEDVAYEECLAEAVREARIEWESEGNDPEDFDEESATDSFGMNYEGGGLSDYLYEQDGYKLTGCLDNDIFVLRSPFYTFAQFCSPCVPGACNLDNPFEAPDRLNPDSPSFGLDYRTFAQGSNFVRCYCLGHDWFDDNRAPYPVFSCETSEIVSPTI